MVFGTLSSSAQLLEVLEKDHGNSILINKILSFSINKTFEYDRFRIPYCSDPYWLDKIFYYPIVAERMGYKKM